MKTTLWVLPIFWCIALLSCSPGAGYTEVDDPYVLQYEKPNEANPEFIVHFTKTRIGYSQRVLGNWEIVASFPTDKRSRSGFEFQHDATTTAEGTFTKLKLVEDTCGKTQLYKLVITYPDRATSESLESGFRICTD